MQSRRPVCVSCLSFDVEAVVDGEPADVAFFACFDCQDDFYFMADARPRVRELGLFELYVKPGAGNKSKGTTGNSERNRKLDVSTADQHELNSHRYELLHRLQHRLETPMLVLAFVWLWDFSSPR